MLYIENDMMMNKLQIINDYRFSLNLSIQNKRCILDKILNEIGIYIIKHPIEQ